MTDQLPSTSDVTNCSVTGNNNLIGFKPIKTFKWTPRLKRYLLQNMKRLKPCEINKHLSILLIKEKMHKELNLNIPIGVLWNYMSDMWNIRCADIIENICFDTSEKDFVLPEDFNQLIHEEGERIKNLKKECLNDEINLQLVAQIKMSTGTLIFPVMTDQLPSTSDVTNCSVTGNNNLIGFKPIKTFKWTPRLKRYLLQNMKRLNHWEINKHSGILLIKEKMHKELNLNIPIGVLWNCMSDMCNIICANINVNTCFDNSRKDFVLPEDFNQLIHEEGERIKNLKKECLNDEINERKFLNCSGKTRSKSNSISSVESKEDFNEVTSSTLLESSPAKTNEVESDDGPSTRRSLSTNDKLENSESDDKNKLKDLKQLNRKTSNKSKSMEKIENIREQKIKRTNVSESSFSSDNSELLRNYKNTLTDSTISDTMSRSVSPDILKGETLSRSITPETTCRELNLRSSDKDHKSKVALEKACLNFGHPEVKIECLKPENQFASLMEAKSKNLIESKNEANNKVRAKIRNRVTSDLLVVQQSPNNILPLGRRSCSYKNP
ncbi:hypothetical protein QTP88_023870 [Uroleucon formosanum]